MKYLVLYKLYCESSAHRGRTPDHVCISMDYSTDSGKNWKEGATWPNTTGGALEINSDDSATINAIYGYDEVSDSDEIKIELINYHRDKPSDPESLGSNTIGVSSSGTQMQSMMFTGENSVYTLYYYLVDEPVQGAKLTGVNCFVTTDEQAGVIDAIGLAFQAASTVAEAAGTALQSAPTPESKAIGVAVAAASKVLNAIPDFAKLIAGATDNPDEIYMTYGATEDKYKAPIYPLGKPTKRMVNGEIDDVIDGDDVQVPILSGAAQVALYEEDTAKSNVIGLAILTNPPLSEDPGSKMQYDGGYSLFIGGQGAGGTGNALYGVSYQIQEMDLVGSFGSGIS